MNLDGELHGFVAGWFPIILLATIWLASSFDARPRTEREWAITLATRAQVAVPLLIAGLLGATGAEHEGGWADTRLHLGLSVALVTFPIALGIWTSCVARGGRALAILTAIASVFIALAMLFSFMIIGC